MTQPTPTPVPDHGTGWGLLFLFINLYGIVALLGVGTVVAFALNHVDRRIPTTFLYLMGVVLLGAVSLSGFIVLLAGTAGRYDVVVLIVLIVFLPLTRVVLRLRGKVRRHVAILTCAAMAWSIPFLVGFGVVAFVGTAGGGITPAVAGVLAVIIVVAGTSMLDHLPIIPEIVGPRE